MISLKDAHARALAQGYTDKSRNAWRMEMQRHPERLAALGLAKIENGAGYQVVD